MIPLLISVANGTLEPFHACLCDPVSGQKTINVHNLLCGKMKNTDIEMSFLISVLSDENVRQLARIVFTLQFTIHLSEMVKFSR
jgi:hypothetical protein